MTITKINIFQEWLLWAEKKRQKKLLKNITVVDNYNSPVSGGVKQ